MNNQSPMMNNQTPMMNNQSAMTTGVVPIQNGNIGSSDEECHQLNDTGIYKLFATEDDLYNTLIKMISLNTTTVNDIHNFIIEYGVINETGVCLTAVCKNRLDILVLLHNHKFPWDKYVLNMCLDMRCFNCAKYLFENKCDIDIRLISHILDAPYAINSYIYDYLIEIDIVERLFEIYTKERVLKKYKNSLGKYFSPDEYLVEKYDLSTGTYMHVLNENYISEYIVPEPKFMKYLYSKGFSVNPRDIIDDINNYAIIFYKKRDLYKLRKCLDNISLFDLSLISTSELNKYHALVDHLFAYEVELYASVYKVIDNSGLMDNNIVDIMCNYCDIKDVKIPKRICGYIK